MVCDDLVNSRTAAAAFGQAYTTRERVRRWGRRGGIQACVGEPGPTRAARSGSPRPPVPLGRRPPARDRPRSSTRTRSIGSVPVCPGPVQCCSLRLSPLIVAATVVELECWCLVSEGLALPTSTCPTTLPPRCCYSLRGLAHLSLTLLLCRHTRAPPVSHPSPSRHCRVVLAARPGRPSGGGVRGRLEVFRKFIKLGTDSLPLYKDSVRLG